MIAPPELRALLAEHLDTSPFGCAVTRVSDGVLVYVNAAGRRLVSHFRHVDPDAIVGRTAADLGMAESGHERQRLIALARRPEGHMERYDLSPHDSSGASLLHSRLLVAAGVEYMVTTQVDISMQVATERALAEATDRLQKAQALARMGDYVFDLQGGDFNGSAEAMRLLRLGDDAATVGYSDLLASFHPDDRAMVWHAMEQQIPSGAFELEHRLAPDETGMVRWVFTRANVEIDANGHRMLRGTLQDITDRKLADEERERLNQKMRETQKLEGLGVLAGGIAHDFNNLLATIMGNADFALLDENADQAMRDRLRAIVTASQRAADLTRQLLAYSGKGNFVVEPIDLSAMIREMADLLKVTISPDHQLHFALSDGLAPVSGDATQLRQVMMNLIINASEAIGAGRGSIRISTRPCVCDDAYIEAASLTGEVDVGECVIVEVADDGVGMDSDTLQRLYDPFFSTKFTGRGLGMAAALGIVKSHSGAIRVQSEPGVGTLFTLYLPVAEAAARPADDTGVRSSDWHGDACVLIVDDDVTVREYAANALERFGYRTLQAEDGRAALEMVASGKPRPDLVLLDLSMPNMDGHQTIPELLGLRRDLPIVLMTGCGSDEALLELDSHPLAGLLPKPFLVDALMRCVTRSLAQPDTHHRLARG